MLLQDQSIADIVGIDGILVFFELELMSIVVVVFFYYGFKFFRQWTRKDAPEIERLMSRGYGFFFTGIGMGYACFLLDRIARFFYAKAGTDGRLFWTDLNWFGGSASSAMNRDYIWLTVMFMGSSFMFLSHLVEKFILDRKPVITAISVFGFVFTILLRPIELAFFYAGLHDVVEYLGYISYGTMAIVLLTILFLYGKIAFNAQRRSELWNKSVSFIVSLLVMVIMLMAGNNQFSKAGDFPGENLLGPIITLVVLMVMNYGFLQGKRSEGDLPVTNATTAAENEKKQRFRAFLDAFTKPKEITEADITYFKDQKVCLVCKSKVSRNLYVCPGCDSLYCSKCAEALGQLENACWACNAPFDDSRAAPPAKKEEEAMQRVEKVEPAGGKKGKGKEVPTI